VDPSCNDSLFIHRKQRVFIKGCQPKLRENAVLDYKAHIQTLTLQISMKIATGALSAQQHQQNSV